MAWYQKDSESCERAARSATVIMSGCALAGQSSSRGCAADLALSSSRWSARVGGGDSMLHLNVFPDGVFLDTEPSERSIPVSLDQKSEEAVRCLLALESFRVAEALGSLTMWALNQAGAANRKLLPS